MTAAGAPRFLSPRRRNEEGMGMILVIGIATVVMLLTAVAVSSATSALRNSTQHVNYEQAIHVAEHGIDKTFAALHDDINYATDTPPDGLSPEQLTDWARTKLQSAPPCDSSSVLGCLQKEPQGEFAVVKPAAPAPGKPAPKVIYAQGWVPSRENARHTRIIKVEYIFSPYNPVNALATDGDLEIAGNPVIQGNGANAHSNADFVIKGNPTIDGDATASGNYSTVGTPTIGGSFGSSLPEEDLPEVDPAKIYERLSAQYAAAWYDLCPNGEVRSPGSAPCTGTLLPGSGTEFKGWKFSGGTWDLNGAAEDGVFYIHEGSAKITGNPGEPDKPWRMTIIAAARPGGSSCPQDFGDIEMEGNPVAVPYIPGLTLVADRDLKIKGHPGMRLEGFFGAGEQLDVSGDTTVYGAMVARDECPDTQGSPISKNSVGGNMNLTYNPNLEAPIDVRVRTTLWLEL